MCATIDSRGQYSDACKQMEYVPAVTVVTCYQHKGRMVTIWRGVTRAIHCHRMLHRGSFAFLGYHCNVTDDKSPLEKSLLCPSAALGVDKLPLCSCATLAV